MAQHRGEEGSVKFKNSAGTAAAVVGTRSWSLTINKETLETTAHGDTFKKYVGGLISGDGSCELIYDSAQTGETANFINDVLTAEDPGDAVFELYLDTGGTKKATFSGIINSMELAATTGELEIINCSFTANGAITDGW